MRLILLAAGMGCRLGQLTQDRPKALIEVSGRALMDHVLALTEDFGLSERVVVTGFEHEALEHHLAEHSDVQTVHNPLFKKGNLYSLKQARAFFEGGFVLMNVDHIYPHALKTKVKAIDDCVTALCDFDRPLVADDMKVKTTQDGTLSEISKKLETWDAGYIGTTVVPASMVSRFSEALDKAERVFGQNAVVENILQSLVNEGELVKISDTSGIRWLEVDTPEDLKAAEDTLEVRKDFLD